MTVLISLPIHERSDVAIDQLQNVRKFMPNSIVIIHLSKGFRGDTKPLMDFVHSPKGMPFVIVNPERLDTAWAGIIQTHLSNFAYAKKLPNLSFSHYAMHASNDMFVKMGAEEYIQAHDCGVQQFPCPSDMMWTPRRRATHDPQLKAIMKEIGATKMVGSQIEGTFYKREMFEQIWDLFDRHFDVNGIAQYGTKDDNDHTNTLYAREELYFSTIASEITVDRVRPYLFSEVMTGVKITPTLIDEIRSSTIDLNSCMEKRICETPYRLYDVDNLYAVKRVARDLRDPLRRYIGGL